MGLSLSGPCGKKIQCWPRTDPDPERSLGRERQLFLNDPEMDSLFSQSHEPECSFPCRADQSEEGARALFSTHAKCEDRSSGLERMLFFPYLIHVGLAAGPGD